jgi:hypothetical protein
MVAVVMNISACALSVHAIAKPAIRAPTVPKGFANIMGLPASLTDG